MSRKSVAPKDAKTERPLTLADVSIEWGPADNTTRLSGAQAAMLLMYRRTDPNDARRPR